MPGALCGGDRLLASMGDSPGGGLPCGLAGETGPRKAPSCGLQWGSKASLPRGAQRLWGCPGRGVHCPAHKNGGLRSPTSQPLVGGTQGQPECWRPGLPVEGGVRGLHPSVSPPGAAESPPRPPVPARAATLAAPVRPAQPCQGSPACSASALEASGKADSGHAWAARGTCGNAEGPGSKAAPAPVAGSPRVGKAGGRCPPHLAHQGLGLQGPGDVRPAQGDPAAVRARCAADTPGRSSWLSCGRVPPSQDAAAFGEGRVPRPTTLTPHLPLREAGREWPGPEEDGPTGEGTRAAPGPRVCHRWEPAPGCGRQAGPVHAAGSRGGSVGRGERSAPPRARGGARAVCPAVPASAASFPGAGLARAGAFSPPTSCRQWPEEAAPLPALRAVALQWPVPSGTQDNCVWRTGPCSTRGLCPRPRLLYQLPLRPLTLASRAVLSPNRPPVPHTQPQRHPAFSWGSSNSTAHPNANLPPRPPVPGPPDCTQ